MEREEIQKLEKYLKEKLHPGMALKARTQTTDSVEVYLGAEFIAVTIRTLMKARQLTSFK